MNIVLLPGLEGTGKLFESLIRCLPDSYEITVISYPLDTHLNYDQLEKHVAAKLPVTPHLALQCAPVEVIQALKVSRIIE